MIRWDLKNRTVSIDRDLYDVVEVYRREKDISSVEKAVDLLIRAGFEHKEEEFPEIVISKLRACENVEVRKKKMVGEKGETTPSIGL